MSVIARLCLALLATTLFSGCAATIDRMDSDGEPVAQASEAASRNIVMTMQRDDDEQSEDDWGYFREEWNEAMTELAAEKNARFTLIDTVTPEFEQPTLWLKTQVHAFRYISPGKRFAFGVMTGNAYMDVEVEFIEMPAGRVLGARRYSTTSKSSEGVFSPVTAKQVQAAARALWIDGIR